MGPGAKSLWFELAKKLAPDLQGWPCHQLLRETVEGFSHRQRPVSCGCDAKSRTTVLTWWLMPFLLLPVEYPGSE